jgi:2-keto-4-pentenoate hydratase/2-oxohepta-3-ene-1,7-dioic acid hydratase in catechol pathway
MKIVGFSNIDETVQMVLKCDSSMLVNRKPFFIPDWSNDVRMTPCAVLRVSRMGKNIGQKFASRYYDAVAPGLNICAADILAQGDSVKAWAFDYSLPLGTFMDLSQWNKETVISFDEAIQRVSAIMTIRQGDLIFVDCNIAARPLVKEEVIVENNNEQELLYCKVK